MSTKITVTGGFVSARWTAVWFLVMVSVYVGIKVSEVIETPPTNITDKAEFV